MEDISQNNTNTSVQPADDLLTPSQTEEVTTNPDDLDSRWLRWKCLNCGYLYEGMQELKKCPKCGNENPDLFEDAA